MNCDHLYKSITSSREFCAGRVRLRCIRCGDTFSSHRYGIPEREPEIETDEDIFTAMKRFEDEAYQEKGMSLASRLLRWLGIPR